MTITNDQKSIAIWLLICCITIYAMVVLGGVTRLTGSGLSMVQWEPIMGALPPMSDAEWERVFTLYQQYPEYQKKNFHMDVDDFKSIFWFEYAHRLLGRLIGVIFIIPLLLFLFLGKVERPLVPKLVAMFVLGGLQGLLGWYMVKSGLVNDPHVSQYRLTAHLSLAFIIYAYLFWVAIDLLFPRDQLAPRHDIGRLRGISYLLTALVFLTIVSGGFVAGLKAGFAYNTFPLMNGQLIPDALFALTPAWRNFFEDITTVQFDHRLLATTAFFLIIAFWVMALREDLPKRARLGIHLLLVALLLQVTLGISTLIMVVPVPLAAAHQGGALLLLTATLFVSHELRNI